MSEAVGMPAKAWFVQRESEVAGSENIQQLSESELHRELLRAGDSLRTMLVKQGNSDWYPAEVVLKKFEQLAQDGVYIRRRGAVQGPYTAAKTIEVLNQMDLDNVQAKVGIHADWVSARWLHIRLQMIQEGIGGEVAKAKPESDKLPADKTNQRFSEDSPRQAESVDDKLEDAQVIESQPIDAQQIDDEIIEVQPIDDQPLIELVMVAEPIALPQKPQPQPQPQPQSVEPVIMPVSRKSRRSGKRPPPPPRRPASSANGSPHKRSDKSVMILLGVTGMLSLLIVAAGITWLVVNRRSAAARTSEMTQNVNGDPGDGSSEITSVAVLAALDGPTPVVREGMLYRPVFRTSMGQATGGNLFSARVGRSNRMVLVGAANLLGPKTGLPRQLRGAEVLIHWEGLEITDHVSAKTREVTGTVIRLRTAEYPSISVHGDALVFEPDKQIGLDPLAVASSLPSRGDRVWLLAKVSGSDALVHGGRWIGAQDDWLSYRLDNEALNVAGTSGGALVNVDHQVIGIQAAPDESEPGNMIASPIKAIITEIQ